MIQKFRHWLRTYFGFSQTEIRGFFSLLLIFIGLLAGVLVTKFVLPTTHYQTTAQTADAVVLQKWVATINEQQQQFTVQQAHYKDSLQEVYEQKYEQKYGKKNAPISVVAAPKQLFVFNPNTVSNKDLQRLGCSEVLAQRIDNYRQKGGQFRIKADFQKIYGMPPTLYQSLYAYIDLPEEFTKNTTPITTPKLAQNKVTNLNEADTTALIRVRGIGSKLANRIVTFRDKLGGFHHLDQLSDVYGLQPEVIAELKDKFTLPANPVVKQFSINTADETTLKAHPYIGYKMAALIVNYRQQHGNFQQLDDLRKIKVMTEEVLIKLKPYLTL